MKRLVFALAAAAAMGASAEMKFGTVDVMLLVRNHPSYESNKAFLTTTDKDYQKKLDAIKAEGDKLQEEGKGLVEQMNNPMLTVKAKAEIETKLRDLQKKLLSIDQNYRSEALHCRQELQATEARLLKTTTDDLRKRITAYAEANGYDVVLDRNATAYAKPGMDITDAMLKEMGVDPAEAKGKDEGK